MGLFENLGRKVERFKQAAEDAAEEEASHRCEDCGEPYYTEQDACPECGGDVVAVEPAVAEGEAGPTDEGSPTDDGASADESNVADATTDETTTDETASDDPEDDSGE